MITVRTLLDTDVLTPPYWPFVPMRPEPSTTLIAIEDDKLSGVVWMAYGGFAMMVCWQSAAPNCAIPLWSAARKLACDRGCDIITCFVLNNDKLIQTMINRGWFVDTTPHYYAAQHTHMQLSGGVVGGS